MIRIRYSSELQPGLNGQAQRLGRTIVVYLLPGLTPGQRRATLRRLRQHGHVGISPRLPAPQLFLALFTDRIKVAFGRAGAIVRTHPAGSTLPLMAVSAAVAGFLLLSAVSIRIVRPRLAGGGPGHGGAAVPTVRARAAPGYGGQPGQAGSGPGNFVNPGTAPGPSQRAGASPAPGHPRPGASASPGSSAGGGRTLSSTAASAPPPGGSTPGPATSAGGRMSARPGATASPDKAAIASTRICVDLGPFGACLSL